MLSTDDTLVLVLDVPLISVVIATHDRKHLLARLVAALCAQEDAPSYEVIIVDDASNDGSWEELSRLAESADVTVRPLRLSVNSGPATARNTGWRAAAGSYVAFTDDDCVPDRKWLAELSQPLGEYEIVQGRTLPQPDQRSRLLPFAHTIHVETESGYYQTCNIAYTRGALVAARGFDESFRHARPSRRRGRPPVHGEDVDLAWRLKEAGARSAFAPDAVVYHEVSPPDYLAYLRENLRRDGLVRALKLHPDLRRRRGVFQNGAHPSALFLLSCLAALATGWRQWKILACAAAAVGYERNAKRHHRHPQRRREWALLLPMYWVADLFEVAILAKASIKYRTIAL